MATVITRYTPQHKEEWDNFVRHSKNGTFLFHRDYMDYHRDRFTDCSLMFYKEGWLKALLPANIKHEENLLQSHGGLTYGGLVMNGDTRTTEVLEMFDALKEYMQKELDVKRLQYKPLPYIYNREPGDEPLYALFRHGAKITARTISTTIDNLYKPSFSEQRTRCIRKALKNGISCSISHDTETFWSILTKTLAERHNCNPVHSAEEISKLKASFPDNIKLYTATKEETALAGVLVYEMPETVHFQYIAASPEGKEHGALDLLISYLIKDVYSEKRYIDFGISTEQGGTILNEGLIHQKEGFGGRAVVYDTYELDI